ncbi:exonuclease 3'-5' domain-containing protein 2-like [Sitodiplosis mosellana]|uniref:exonuclease 3'-5' domain-containing protein 2-like n=1 Tax=Sitodiplosis mosellana TaxID=263140 RepID=UPI0024441771|nr:exonuclease 3'-5' domain-containing protein 2-like [Sitodiplosis mosellana]
MPRSHVTEYNVLGFDCESKSPGGRETALLQLATHRGLCVLIRLCKMKTIPIELQTILEDKTILKVGIAPHSDANKLFSGYRLKVAGVMDLKYLAKKCKCKSQGIGKLSEEVLKVRLSHKEKGLLTQKIHKKWENDALDDENIKYAADDAHVAIELFKKFQEKLMQPTTCSGDQTKDVQKFIDEYCMSYWTNKQKKYN